MTRPLSPAAVTRLAAEMDALGNRMWLLSEDVLAQATALKEQARQLRAALEEERDLERGREFAGPSLRVVERESA